ncbi:hypothetical protein LCGC14_1694690 [marine sediment metagenome]|uniref:Uncharacterized protein n=1 Tax=marine sediment metagenome TaxID=412755 RepID=A0A0F9KJX1_9ZZZZ
MTTDDIPVDDEGRSIPAYALYPVKAVAWATFFGSPLAGGIVMAINYGRLGRPGAKRNALLWSALATAALFTVIFLIPDDLSIPHSVFYIPQLAAMYAIAHSLQGPAIKLHRERGGSLASVWRAVGVGCVCGPFILGGMVGGAHVVDFNKPAAVLKFNHHGEVYYSGQAAKEDAQFLGETLTAKGIFGTSSGGSVYVKASSHKYTISFVLVEGAWGSYGETRGSHPVLVA